MFFHASEHFPPGLEVLKFSSRTIGFLLLMIVSMPSLSAATQENDWNAENSVKQLPALDNVPTTLCFWDTARVLSFSDLRCPVLPLRIATHDCAGDSHEEVLRCSRMQRSIVCMSLHKLGLRLDI
jgi:hypothetical protein